MGTLNLAEAAAVMKRKSVRYFRQNLVKWGVPHKRQGKSYLFTEEALMAYINTRQALDEEEQCLSSVKEVATGRSVSREYESLLGQTTTKTLRPTRTGETIKRG